MSRFAITSHAVERWAQLVDPVLGYDAAAVELRAGLAGRPERCGVTRRGQAVFRVEAPRLAYLVVKLGPDKLGKFYAGGGAAGVIVTVLPPEMWEGSERELVDEARELLEYRASIAVPTWRPPAAKPGDPAPVAIAPPEVKPEALEEHRADWRSWAWTCGAIERERRIAEHYKHEREEQGAFRRHFVAVVHERVTPEIYQAWCREAERRGSAGDL